MPKTLICSITILSFVSYCYYIKDVTTDDFRGITISSVISTALKCTQTQLMALTVPN